MTPSEIFAIYIIIVIWNFYCCYWGIFHVTNDIFWQGVIGVMTVLLNAILTVFMLAYITLAGLSQPNLSVQTVSAAKARW
jgi:hypothetical protein